jgi:hypothetical protein
MSESELYDEATRRYLNNTVMIEASREFEAAAIKIETSFKRRNRAKALALGSCVVVLGTVFGAGFYFDGKRNGLASSPAAGQPTGKAYQEAARCHPLASDNSIKSVTIAKATLPPHPTNINIATQLARQVPGAEACGGEATGARRYQSFIRLVELDQQMGPNANSMVPLTTLLEGQTGPQAYFWVPAAINAHTSH